MTEEISSVQSAPLTTYTSDDVGFTSALLCALGQSVLAKITFDDCGHAIFHLSVPHDEATAYRNDFDAGRLGVTDVKFFCRTYTGVTTILKDMRYNGDAVWSCNAEPPASHSEEWWARAREAGEQRRREREAYEQRRNQPIARRGGRV